MQFFPLTFKDMKELVWQALLHLQSCVQRRYRDSYSVIAVLSRVRESSRRTSVNSLGLEAALLAAAQVTLHVAQSILFQGKKCSYLR